MGGDGWFVNEVRPGPTFIHLMELSFTEKDKFESCPGTAFAGVV